MYHDQLQLYWQIHLLMIYRLNIQIYEDSCYGLCHQNFIHLINFFESYPFYLFEFFKLMQYFNIILFIFLD